MAAERSRMPGRGIPRRTFLMEAAAGAAAFVFAGRSSAAGEKRSDDRPLAAGGEAGASPGLPAVDLHVHLDDTAHPPDRVSLDRVLELSRERGVKFGIVEHAGTRENKYPIVLSNDEEMAGWLKLLEGKPVWRGIQAEWTDWMSCFSKETLARLDFILTDAMTFPGKDGRRAKLWEGGVEIGDPESFMDRFVDWHLEIIEKQPIDILANTSWLPAPLDKDHDRFWTPARMKKVLEAAVKNGVAIEISSGFKLPKLPFLRAAKAAGAKFSFGSNGRHPNMGKLEYSFQMAKELELTAADIFTPAPEGKKAVQRRKFQAAAPKRV
jgi:histidinol phosphatase-like PHP family hydrolase